MKNIKIYIVVFLFLTSCSSSHVEDVKDTSVLLDGSVKIGAAFDQYPYFKKIIWSTCSEESGRKIILLAGEYNLEKVQKSTPVFMSSVEEAAFAPLLKASKRLSPDSLSVKYLVQLARKREKAGNIFEVEFAGFLFASPEPHINKALRELKLTAKSAALQGLRDICSGNTAEILLIMGAVALAAKAPCNTVSYRPNESFTQ